MAAQLPDRVTAVASHLEWGLIWDMQKMIIKVGPTALLAEHYHATGEQISLPSTPGSFARWAKALGNGAHSQRAYPWLALGSAIVW